ncbi:zinc finger protein 672-like [Megalops cyprinoides]|uniref:zinc finger protein 672-like n=1 Tax=Megalops cyprinoides TaxID=118141 RepID=UPI0018654CF2|nr:zinc finger protein 672-like [Megalops cyprinoides]
MEAVCVKGRTLDLDTLMVIVKQEEEEREEQLCGPQETSLLHIKQEQDEEGEREPSALHPLGHSPPCAVPVQAPKEDPDDLEEGEREGKKMKKRRREEKEWAPMAAADGSGADSLWRCRLCQRCFSSSWELTGHCCTGIAGAGGTDGDGAKLEFRCPVCGDRFLRPTAFIMHKRSHVGQSRYVCGVCGRTLKTLPSAARRP